VYPVFESDALGGFEVIAVRTRLSSNVFVAEASVSITSVSLSQCPLEIGMALPTSASSSELPGPPAMLTCG